MKLPGGIEMRQQGADILGRSPSNVGLLWLQRPHSKRLESCEGY